MTRDHSVSILVVAAILVVCLPASLFPGTDAGLRATDTEAIAQDLLPTIWEGMRAAASAIRTGRGEVSVRQWTQRNEGGILEVDTKYQVVFMGKLFKTTASATIVQNTPGQGEEGQALVSPGAESTRVVSFDGNRILEYWPGRAEARISDPTLGVGLNEIRLYNARASIFGHGFISAGPTDPVPANVRVVAEETINGDKCYVLEVRDGYDKIANRRQIWVSPTKGYFIVRVRSWLQEGSDPEFMNYEINRTAREYAPGIWGPAVDKQTDYARDRESGSVRKSREITTTFSQDFQVNAAVGSADISLTLPSGTQVRDNIIDAEYVVP